MTNRHIILEDYGTTLEWPDANSPDWVSYSTPLERKRSLCKWSSLPAGCRQLLSELSLLPVGSLFAMSKLLVPDTSLWGAGANEMQAGGFLDLHLDADRHRWLALERRANAVLFLDAWRPEWGGTLELWTYDQTGPEVSVQPAAGRLVLFEPSTPHRVTPLTCPPGVLRRTLSVFWYSACTGPSQRPRANFLPLPGEPPDQGKDQLRISRAGKNS